MNEDIYLASAVAALDDRHACRHRVLGALEEILKFDSDPRFREAARSRYLDLTEDQAQ